MWTPIWKHSLVTILEDIARCTSAFHSYVNASEVTDCQTYQVSIFLFFHISKYYFSHTVDAKNFICLTSWNFTIPDQKPFSLNFTILYFLMSISCSEFRSTLQRSMRNMCASHLPAQLKRLTIFFSDNTVQRKSMTLMLPV